MGTLVEDKKQERRSLIVRWQLAVSFLAAALIGANDGAFGVLIPSLGSHYTVDKATISYLFLASTLGYFVASFNSGLLLEKLGNRIFLVLASGILIMSFGIIGFRPPFFVLLFVYMSMGFGVAMLDAGLNSFIAVLPRNTVLLNYFHAFYGMGAWLGPALASTILALQLGWSSVYVVWSFFSLITLVFVASVFRQPVAAQKQAEQAEKNVMSAALRLRVVWLGALFLLFYVGTEVGLGSWSYSFLVEERHGPTLLSGWIVSGYWFGLTLGRLVLGFVGEKVGRNRLIEGCLVGTVVGMLLIWLVPLHAVAALGLLLTGFSLGPIFPTMIALMSDLVSNRLLPSAIGFMASLGSMGAALFPWLVGNLAQHIGLWTLLPFMMVLAAIMLALWLVLQRQPAQAME